ncbi:hypothetical protein, partial [Candidatus Sororendozoicomonas aggregata]|uniref:hypothetical protein n=1 Tax=Candidatus Sororendozoicomonas aggregata TaxID=3073239 RepID=UPI002ED69076
VKPEFQRHMQRLHPDESTNNGPDWGTVFLQGSGLTRLSGSKGCIPGATGSSSIETMRQPLPDGRVAISTTHTIQTSADFVTTVSSIATLTTTATATATATTTVTTQQHPGAVVTTVLQEETERQFQDVLEVINSDLNTQSGLPDNNRPITSTFFHDVDVRDYMNLDPGEGFSEIPDLWD